jgi:hypothetical protein
VQSVKGRFELSKTFSLPSCETLRMLAVTEETV